MFFTSVITNVGSYVGVGSHPAVEASLDVLDAWRTGCRWTLLVAASFLKPGAERTKAAPSAEVLGVALVPVCGTMIPK